MSEEAKKNEQYLSFTIKNEKYAVSVKKVKEVLEMVPITKVPKMPAYMRGVLNLRGSVVPVIDLRLKFGLEAVDETINTRIVILEIENDDELLVVGAITDSVQEVLDIGIDDIEEPPKFGLKINNEFISGMFETGDKFLILLDIDRVLNTDDIILLTESNNETNQIPEEINSEA